MGREKERGGRKWEERGKQGERKGEYRGESEIVTHRVSRSNLHDFIDSLTTSFYNKLAFFQTKFFPKEDRNFIKNI